MSTVSCAVDAKSTACQRIFMGRQERGSILTMASVKSSPIIESVISLLVRRDA